MLNYQNLKKMLFKIDPEKAHLLAEFGMRFTTDFMPFLLNIIASKYFVANERLEQEIWGVDFPNPVGIAAGFDKNATMIKALSALGFGYVEYGTITPKPQIGNAKPRLFRHIEEESLQNAMGFNNEGISKVSKRISKIYPYAIPLGANIGKNKTTSQENAISDYEKLTKALSPFCDYLTVNISSPNTPNLRDLQNENFIKELFKTCVKLTDKPILLKIAPDMSEKNAISICEAAIEEGAKGIIAVNTTVDYSLVANPQNIGGISGKVLKDKSLKIFKALAKEFYGKTILISAGGISSARDAYERVLEGASLVQIYTSFIYEGPSVAHKINTGILELMDKDGFCSIKDAVGSKIK
ncbi:MAG: quinone-dependent dihydroorotate dehydrogenase [Campylobacteraceae bacterium]|jgi:dihydroorotate dehydrogenase|nr:quinone-dependent dihydroorotate dehydrogenase [Campylobacteraceae bacterium]